MSVDKDLVFLENSQESFEVSLKSAKRNIRCQSERTYPDVIISSTGDGGSLIANRPFSRSWNQIFPDLDVIEEQNGEIFRQLC